MTQTSPAIRAGTEPDGPGTEPTEEERAWDAYQKQLRRSMRWTYVLGGYSALVISSATYEAVSGNWKPVIASAAVIIINLILTICSLLSSNRVVRRRMEWREAYWELRVNMVEKQARQDAILHMLLRAKLN